MKISFNWLRDSIDLSESPEVVARALTDAGLEIEGIQYLGKGLEQVFTATVLAFEKHPNADRLSVCQVSAGEKKLSLVCGAKNFKAGDRVVLALPGVTLPNGLTLKETVIRNVPSHGMLCSETELGLAPASEGILILPAEVPEGVPLTQALPIQDVIFEVNITPNRGDCLSVAGLVREIACAFGISSKPKAKEKTYQGPKALGEIKAEIQAPELCPRYTCRLVRGVKIGPTPLWVRRRLESCGIRPINNVVDATNFVMIETGQPLHAFDLKLIHHKQVLVRVAKANEKLKLLDGTEQNLQAGDLVIADGDRILALAGVMGGEDSGVQDGTVDLLLESAYFSPSAVRKTAKRLGLSTESSYRFERGIDPNGCRTALDRLTEVILQWAGGEASRDAIDLYPNKILPAKVPLRATQIKRILGVEFAPNQFLPKLQALGIGAAESKAGVFEATVPTFRSDLTREIDLIEEVARTVGYDKIPVAFPKIPIHELPHGRPMGAKALSHRLKEWGFTEALHFSFAAPELFKKFGETVSPAMRLKNPLSEDQAVMRPRLLPQMVQTLQKNAFNGATQMALFELRPVYVAEQGVLEGHREPWHLCLALAGERHGPHYLEKAESVSFPDLKGVLAALLNGPRGSLEFGPTQRPYFHPKRSAELLWKPLGGQGKAQPIGELGELHPAAVAEWGLSPPIVLAEIDVDLFLTDSEIDIQFQEIPAFPRVQRDLNLIVDEDRTHGQVLEVIQKEGGPLLRAHWLFDLFRGKPLPDGKKALTYRLEYGAPDRTLTDEEVNQARDGLLNQLKKHVGAELR